MRKALLFIAVFFTIIQTTSAFNCKNIKISNLKTETLENPLGLDMLHPRFSWQLTTKQTDVLQNALQIWVADSPEKLKAGKDLMWNSNKLESGSSVLIVYNGKPLQSKKTYYWKVKVWTNKGETAWSDAARFTMVFMDNPLSKAKWIGMDSMLNSGKLTTKTKLSARYLRKEFSVDKKIEKATIYISGLGLYECYINGEKISNDIFAPTASDYTKRVFYNVYDVKSMLNSNENAIAVILGNGRFFSMRRDNVPGGDPLDSPAQVHYGFPKLLMQLEIKYNDGTSKTIVSDKSWKITTNGPIVANNEFDGEVYDANLEMKGWNMLGFNENNWRNVELVEAPAGKLNAQLNPNLATMRELKPIAIKEIEKGKYVVDMGQNMVGWLAVTLKGEKNKAVKLHYAETNQKDGNIYTANLRGSINTDIYTPSSNEKFTYEPRFVYHGFRYVEITGIDYLPSVNDFVGKVNYDQMTNSGTFVTSDTTLNQIYRNAAWGIMGNYRSMPTDCPQRDERMGWLGDRATGCFGESFMFNNQLLYSKWAYDIQDSQLPNGSLPDVAPAYWQFYSDNITWPAAYIHVNNMLYEQFGDPKSVIKHYDAMKKWLNYMQANYMKDYIITKDQYGDWCMPPETLDIIWSKDPLRITDGEILSTTFFYRLLNIMAKNADIVGNKNDKKEFLALAEKVKTAYNAKFFQPEKAQYGNNTVTANIISLMQGLVPAGYEQKVFENLSARIENDFNSHVSVGLIGIQFLMRGLTEYGRGDLAYKIATNRTYPSWGYMIDNGATTIWELWNGNTADPAMNSGNHVMLLGDLLSWFYENLGGIKTDKTEVGFKKISMKPIFPKGLNFVNASHESPYGLIKSEWKKENENLSWTVAIPANSSAQITLPTSSISNILINGKPLKVKNNLKIVDQNSKSITLNVGSGNYDFKVLNAVY